MRNLREFIIFAFISGLGVTIDFVIMWCLLSSFGFTPFLSNCIGNVCGISFVFFVSSHKLFINKGHLIYLKFLVYLIYSACLIFIASSTIQCLSYMEIVSKLQHLLFLKFLPQPVFAKMIVTPFTLIINFIVAKLLIERIKI